jgi:PhoD related phosphatase
MARVCGPLLGFREQDGDVWRLIVLVVHDDATIPAPLSYGEGATRMVSDSPPTLLGEMGGGLRFYGYEFAVPLGASERTIDYGLVGEDRRWSFIVPGRAQQPRVAYASCNGFSSPGEMRKIGERNALWTDLCAQHARTPFHILLMGGDQIYADQVWSAIPELRSFNDLPRHERVSTQASPGLRGALERFYAATYRDRFAQPEVAQALASIPTLMMWDDHDIFDGWGSYSDEEQASPIFQAIFEAARSAFCLFQLQSDPRAVTWPALPGQAAFNALLRIGAFGLLILDLRSERAQSQVMSANAWARVFEALDQQQGLQHLLVMASIPVIHPDTAFIERALDVIPGRQDLEDDLHDQWSSYNHKTERLRLIHRLLDFADATGTRVTLLSGDVHVAALGVVTSDRRPVRQVYANVINQLTSSPIVHPPAPTVVRYFLEQVGKLTQELDRGVRAEMQTFPGTGYRFIGARNWLALEFDDRGRIWANWHIEDEPDVLTKVIHPCEAIDRGASSAPAV